MVTFTFTRRRHLIRLASASFISFHLAMFGSVRFPCATRGKHNAEFTKGGWELWSHFKPFYRPKFRKFSDDVGSPLYFPTPFSSCLCHVSFRRYSPLSLEVVEKRTKCKRFWPQIFVGGTALTFVQQFVRATYYPLLGKVRLSSVCWPPSVTPGNEEESRIYGGWVKMAVEL